MPNSEGKKRPLGRVETMQKRKRKQEYTRMNTAGVESMKGSESTQEEKYRMLVQNIPCAVYSAYPGKAGPTTFMSNKWKDWTGYSPEELYQDPKTWPKCIHPDDRDKAVNAYSGACHDNVPYNLEYRIVHKETGQIRYVRDQGLLSKDKKGDIIRVDGIITDISEYKRAEGTIRESEERFRMMLENLPNVAIQGYGPDGTIHYWNKANESIYGYTAKEALGKGLVELIIPPEMRDYVREAIAHGACTGEMPPAAELNLMRKDGSRVPVWSSHAVVQHAGREPELYCIDVDLRELKRTEKALRESEQKRRLFIENFDGIAYQASHLTFRPFFFYGKIEEITGYKGDDFTAGRVAWNEIIHPDDLDEMIKMAENLRDMPGYVADCEYRIRTRGGQMRWVRDIGRAIRMEDGQTRFVQGAIYDITERKQAEEALRESEERYRGLSEAAFESIFISEKGVCLEQNSTAEKMFGYTLSEAIGRKGTEWIAPEDREMVMNNMLSGYEEPYEATALHKDGTIFPVEIQARMMHYKGRTVRVTALRDITERKQAKEALHLSQERFRTVIETAQDSIFIKDHKLKYTHVNPAMERLFGISAPKLIGCTDGDLFGTEAGEHIREIDSRVLEGQIIEEEHTKPVEGVPVTFHVVKVPMHDATGKIVGLCGIARDITERKRTEEQLRRHHDHLEELVKKRTAELTNAYETLKVENQERKRAEQTLREVEREKTTVLENLSDLIVYRDRDMVTLWASKSMANWHGMTQDQIVGRVCYKARYGRDEPCEECHVIEAIKSGKRQELEKQLPCEKCWHVIVNPVLDDSDQVIGTIEVSQDITERVQAEKALKESEEKFRSLADRSPNMIFINKKGKVVYANKKCEEVMGYTKEELCSDDFDFRTLIAPESLGLINDNFVRYLRGEEVAPYDYCLINKKGERIEAINAIKLIQYEGETAILGVITDITERKRAEQALRESEERLKILFESAPDSIYLIDSKGRFVDGNKMAFELVGFDRDEVIGKSLAEIGLLSDGQLSKAKANLKKAAAGKLSGPNQYNLKKKDGSHVSVEVRTFPVKIGGKMLTLGIARDVTEQKRTEKELLEHQAKLKSLASQLSLTEERERHRLATDLHDQISQSLVISKIKLDQLRKSSTSDEFNKPLEDIGNCLGQIIDDTRTLTFDLSYPILYELGFEAAVAEWLTDQIQEKHGIRTEFVDDGHEKSLDDDIRVLLFRNVRELLINVVKHAQANKVEVSIRKVKGHVRVSVEDDGVGFDPVEVTSMAAKRAEFGLFSIRERLEQLEGLIEIDSETGRGSKITMTAPLKREGAPDR